MIDKANFYKVLKQRFGKFTNKQFGGFEAILNHWGTRNDDVRKLAYILATVWHETDTTMQPIAEYGKGRSKQYGKPHSNGKVYYGRGHTQNTWFENYTKLTKAAKLKGFDWDFVNHPDLLLTMQPSVWATFYAMETGLYTGKKLEDYFNIKKGDPVNARRIINGTDKAKLIESYYNKFLWCLTP